MADNNRVRPLLFPRSVAVVGASPRHGRIVEEIVRSGIPAWGVHPTRDEVLGLPCFPNVAGVPDEPELVALLVGHERVEDAFAEALAVGMRVFFLPGLGNEAGALGPEIAARIAERAKVEDAVLLGPNCMGVAAPEEASIWIAPVPDTSRPGRVSVVSQSGSIAEALLGIGPRVGFRSVGSSRGGGVPETGDCPGSHAE